MFPNCLNAAASPREIGPIRDLDSWQQVASGRRAESPRGFFGELTATTALP